MSMDLDYLVEVQTEVERWIEVEVEEVEVIEVEIGAQGEQGEPGPTPVLQSTSNTSNSIGIGSKTFALNTPTDIVVGMLVRANRPGLSTPYMIGMVTAVSPTSITFTSASTNGSGTYADWVIILTGTTGPAGATGATGPAAPQTVWNQSVALSSWTIPHTLGRRPNVVIYIDDEEVESDVYSTNTSVTIVFPTPMAGQAVLT